MKTNLPRLLVAGYGAAFAVGVGAGLGGWPLALAVWLGGAGLAFALAAATPDHDHAVMADPAQASPDLDAWDRDLAVDRANAAVSQPVADASSTETGSGSATG